MLQAEKVLSLPLDLRLSKDYRYRLEGVEKVDGRDAYAVRFDPLDECEVALPGHGLDRCRDLRQGQGADGPDPPLGRRWSRARRSSSSLRKRTSTGLPIHLLSRFTTRQVMLIAGRNLHGRAAGAASRASASTRPTSRPVAPRPARSDNVMYRDTDLPACAISSSAAATAWSRTGHPNTAKALAVGVDHRPVLRLSAARSSASTTSTSTSSARTTSSPCSSAGSWLLGNVQRPKAIGDQIAASVDLFAIAVASNDQVFDEHGRAGGASVFATIPSRPASTSAGRSNPFQKLTGSYQFRFDAYSRTDETAPDFEPPREHRDQRLRPGLRVPARRVHLPASGSYYRRAPGSRGGAPGDYEPEQRTYEKYSASLSKDFFFKALHKLHLNAAYFGGRDLDRFSEYQFGLFEDNRIHGVPSSGVRFSELGMVRRGVLVQPLRHLRRRLLPRSGPGPRTAAAPGRPSPVSASASTSGPRWARSCGARSARASCPLPKRRGILRGADHLLEAALGVP